MPVWLRNAPASERNAACCCISKRCSEKLCMSERKEEHLRECIRKSLRKCTHLPTAQPEIFLSILIPPFCFSAVCCGFTGSARAGKVLLRIDMAAIVARRAQPPKRSAGMLAQGIAASAHDCMIFESSQRAWCERKKYCTHL